MKTPTAIIWRNKNTDQITEIQIFNSKEDAEKLLTEAMQQNVSDSILAGTFNTYPTLTANHDLRIFVANKDGNLIKH